MSKIKERLKVVLQRMADLVEAMDKDEAICWAGSLDVFLDEMAAEDAFGTEGQTDPRGDSRNGQWSVRRRIEDK